jgi:hypothetical protein
LDEAESKAAERMRAGGAQEVAELITPRELDEAEAIENWCERISVKCTEEAQVSNKTKGIKQAEDLLGESFTLYVPPIPSSSPSGESSPPPPEEGSTKVVDCRVAVGSNCRIIQGMSTLTAPAA